MIGMIIFVMLAFLSLIIGLLIGFIVGLIFVTYVETQNESFSLYSSCSLNDNIEIKRTNNSFKIRCKDKELFDRFIEDHNLSNIKIGTSMFYCNETGSIQINWKEMTYNIF